MNNTSKKKVINEKQHEREVTVKFYKKLFFAFKLRRFCYFKLLCYYSDTFSSRQM